MTITTLSVWRGESPARDRIEVRSASGLVGLGEGRWCESALRDRPEFLLGRSPFEMEAIFDDLAGAAGETPGGLDIALWDLAGKALAQPVHEILGKRYRPSIPARPVSSAEFLVEPCPESDLEGYRRLRETSGLPIAAGASFALDTLVRDFIQTELVDLAIAEVGACGLTGLRRLSYLCWVFHVRLAVVSSGSPVSTAAALHAVACFPPVTNALAAPAPFVVLPNGTDGMLVVPPGPGLGAGSPAHAEPDFILGGVK